MELDLKRKKEFENEKKKKNIEGNREREISQRQLYQPQQSWMCFSNHLTKKKEEN